MALIELQNLSLDYAVNRRKIRVLKSVNLKIESGRNDCHPGSLWFR